MEEEMITITMKEYRSLLKDRKWRDALESGGVDNWPYCTEALRDGGYFDKDEEE
jgi:hypothetical protein